MLNLLKQVLIKKNGFTIIELMIVISIILILYAVAFPIYRPLKNENALYSEAQKIASYLRLIQQLAFDESTNYFFKFDSDNKTYHVGYDGTTDIKFDTLYDNVQYDNVNSTGNIIIDSNGEPVDGNGSPVDGNEKIVLKSGSNNLKIDINVGARGRVNTSWEDQ